MDSLNDLITQLDLAEPPEIKIIKDYVAQEFNAKVGVKLQARQIVIFANSAALAASLRMHLFELKKLLNTDKRLVIFIGQSD